MNVTKRFHRSLALALTTLALCGCGGTPEQEKPRCSNIPPDQDFHQATGTFKLMMREEPPSSEYWQLAVQPAYGAKVNGCAFVDGVERWTVSLDFALPNDIGAETQINSEGYEAPYFIGALAVRDDTGKPVKQFGFGGLMHAGGEVKVQEYSRDGRKLRMTARGYFDFDLAIDWAAEAIVSQK